MRAVTVLEPATARPAADGWTAYGWPRVDAPPHALVALRIPHAFTAGERYLREGWQSWSTPTVETLGTGAKRFGEPMPPAYGRRHWLYEPPYDGDESYHLWRSESATALIAEGSGVFVADGDGLQLAREQPADGRHPDVLYTPTQADPAALMRRCEDLGEPYAGISTWDSYKTLIDGPILAREAAIAARRLIVDPGSRLSTRTGSRATAPARR